MLQKHSTPEGVRTFLNAVKSDLLDPRNRNKEDCNLPIDVLNAKHKFGLFKVPLPISNFLLWLHSIHEDTSFELLKSTIFTLRVGGNYNRVKKCDVKIRTAGTPTAV